MNWPAEARQLIVLGMHRSGTSLFTNWLQECGMCVGDFLIEPHSSNPKGHFEDRDFHAFHEKALTILGTSWELANRDSGKLRLPEYLRDEAQFLVSKKNRLHEQWAMKDPRTCLFVRDWAELMPRAKFAILFRRPDEVVLSLYKRFLTLERCPLQLTRILPGRRRQLLKTFLAAWTKYNLCIVAFLQQVPQSDRIVMEHTALSASGERFINHLQREWGFQGLRYRSPATVIQSDLMRSRGTRLALADPMLDEARRLYDELVQLAERERLARGW
jgi:hypothetical protein